MRPGLSLSVAVVALLLSSAPESVQVRAALTHDALGRLELWRLWSGHVVHFGAAHARGDLLAFVVWASLLEARSRALLGALLVLAAPLSSVAILLWCGTLAEYRGLSALDASLFVAVMLVRGEQGHASNFSCGVWRLGLTAFALKCSYEFITGRALLAPDLGSGAALLPFAHVVGAVLGAISALVFMRHNRRIGAKAQVARARGDLRSLLRVGSRSAVRAR